MDETYFLKIKSAWVLYCNFGLKFATRKNRETILSRNPVPIEMHAKIAAEIKSTFIGDFPSGLLWLFKNFRMYVNNQRIEGYYYDEERRLCFKVKNGSEYLLAFIKHNPNEYAIFIDVYNFWMIPPVNDIPTAGYTTQRRILNPTRLFNKIFRFLTESQIPEFFIHDYHLFTDWGSYWDEFRRTRLVFCHNIHDLKRYRTFTSDLMDAWNQYCLETNNDVTKGFWRLQKLITGYRKKLLLVIKDPETKRRTYRYKRGYEGFRLRDELCVKK